jgi:hypothetical protein
MTPQEKAQELYLAMVQIKRYGTDITDINPFARECMIVAIDQIKANVSNDPTTQTFWDDVKAEIDNI